LEVVPRTGQPWADSIERNHVAIQGNKLGHAHKFDQHVIRAVIRIQAYIRTRRPVSFIWGDNKIPEATTIGLRSQSRLANDSVQDIPRNI